MENYRSSVTSHSCIIFLSKTYFQVFVLSKDEKGKKIVTKRKKGKKLGRIKKFFPQDGTKGKVAIHSPDN